MNPFFLFRPIEGGLNVSPQRQITGVPKQGTLPHPTPAQGTWEGEVVRRGEGGSEVLGALIPH